MLRLPRLISSGMVLQQGTEPRLWGQAEPGRTVRVACCGHTRETQADGAGKWRLSFPAPEAGGPYEMTVSSLAERITLTDVWVGEVWVCGGQSNMELPVSRVAPLYEAELRHAHNPLIRQFKVSRRFRYDGPCDDYADGAWESVRPETVGGFYAASYFFAQEIHARLGVPVGLINSAAGGSSIAAWMDAPDETAAPYADPDALAAALAEKDAVHAAWLREIDEADAGLKEAWYADGDTAGWESVPLTASWEGHPWLARNGAFWFKRAVTLPPEAAGQPGKLLLGCIKDSDTAYVNGVQVGATGYQYPPRRYDIPAGLLKAGENALAVRVVSGQGVGGFVPGKAYTLTCGGTVADLDAAWRYKTGAVAERPLPETVVFEKIPAGLWRGMMAPAVGYTLRGVLWYQGESDTDRPEGYGRKFAAMAGEWRRQWGQGDFLFIYAQLANFAASSGWPALREEQRKCLAVPRTAMTVNIDLGEYNDLHPLNKKAVGYRLALAALGLAYGQDIAYSGPMADAAFVSGGDMYITFAHAEGLTARGGPLTLAVAGSDRRFTPIAAEVETGGVKVAARAVPPGTVYARYAWEADPSSGLLYNGAGLPASPFELKLRPGAQGVDVVAAE